jgi:predicted MFS family arabinose efflux permease
LAWAFGLNEALDQTGAIIGPLSVAAVLAAHGQNKTAFAMLLIPALITLTLLAAARLIYPSPEGMETDTPNLDTGSLPRIFWIYLAGAALVAADFPDFSMMSYHFGKMDIVSATWIPVFYALAMGSSGLGSLVFGRLFDRKGLLILIPLTVVTTLFAPLAFLGGFWVVLVGCGGGWAWAFMNPSSPPPFPRWCRRSAGPRPMAFSAPLTGYLGSSAAP